MTDENTTSGVQELIDRLSQEGVAEGVGQDIAPASQTLCRCVAVTVDRRHGLPCQDECNRTVGDFHDAPPGDGDLIGVCWTEHYKPRNRPQ